MVEVLLLLLASEREAGKAADNDDRRQGALVVAEMVAEDLDGTDTRQRQQRQQSDNGCQVQANPADEMFDSVNK